MKTVCLLAFVAALLLTAGASAQNITISPSAATSATPAATSSGMALFKSDKERVGYIMGTGIGQQMRRQGLQTGDFDPNFVGKGIADTLADKIVLTDEEMQQVMMAFQTEIRAKMAEKTKVEGEKNKTEGDKFLADNKDKEGVKTLPSGLQYKVIKEGAGDIPTAADSVTVNYSGKFLDGTEFDSSYKRGQPASFPVGGVIPAWTEILQKMKVGSKYEIWVPGALGYGEHGNPPRIPPNATLHFEIELLSIDKTK
jgi:FKBP-type peptidyl-prolyl cis-trans isomerase FklB